MLRYKTKTRPGLVALYDIRPGNVIQALCYCELRTGSEINDDFNRNSQIFPTSVYLTLPLRGLEFRNIRWPQETRPIWLSDRENV